MNKSKEFPYSELRDSRGDTILRPLLPLELDYRNKKLEVRGLLDSGADVLGQVNFFLEFDVCFFRSRGILQVGQKSTK
jgi:hypothetical protein